MAYKEARTTILQRFNDTPIGGRKMILVFFYMLCLLLGLMRSVPFPFSNLTA